jgi:hypothetical protein
MSTRRLLVLLSVAASACGSAHTDEALTRCAPPAGRRCPAGSAWQARHDLSSAQLVAATDALRATGHRLSHVSGYALGGQEAYAAIWEQCDAPRWEAHHGLDAVAFQAKLDAYGALRWRLVELVGYAVAGTVRYAAIWEDRDGPPWQVAHGLGPAEYQARTDALVAEGYRTIHVSGYALGDQDRYGALWEACAPGAWAARHALSADAYQVEHDALAQQGLRPAQVSTYALAGADHYAAVWEPTGSAPFQAAHGMSSIEYQTRTDQLSAQGWRVVDVSAAEGAYAAIWER